MFIIRQEEGMNRIRRIDEQNKIIENYGIDQYRATNPRNLDRGESNGTQGEIS